MTELPCFLTTNHVVFKLGDCGYNPTPDPIITLIQLTPIIIGGLLCGGLVYYGLKYMKEKKASQSIDNVRGE